MANKDDMREAFVRGYEMGKHVEVLDEMSVRAAETDFESWYTVNFEE